MLNTWYSEYPNNNSPVVYNEKNFHLWYRISNFYFWENFWKKQRGNLSLPHHNKNALFNPNSFEPTVWKLLPKHVLPSVSFAKTEINISSNKRFESYLRRKVFPWAEGSKHPLNFSTSPTRAKPTQNKKFFTVQNWACNVT